MTWRVVLALVVCFLAGCDSASEKPATSDAKATKPEASEPPALIAALTTDGDVVVIDRVTLARKAKLGSFRRHEDPETGLVYREVEDLTALGNGRVLVSTCCEPAGGAVFLVAEGREPADTFSGWDPQIDSTGARVAIAGIPGIAIHEALAPRPGHTLEVDGDPNAHDYMPADPAWSPDGRKLVFTVDGRLGTVPATASSLAEATFLAARDGKFWFSPVFTTEGVVAVERTGSHPGRDSSGPSGLLSVDLERGESVELASSSAPITDLAIDRSGRHLIWVDGRGLHWRIDGTTSSLEGDFVAATWFPAAASTG
jgi:WD40-like Beta Propeller Repeat